jgi:hypothetical protein
MSLKGPMERSDQIVYRAATKYFAAGAGGAGGAPAPIVPVKIRREAAAADFAALCKKLDAVVLEEDENEGVVWRKEASCTVIRRRINEFQGGRGVTVSAWLEYIGSINSNSYGKFMS